MLSVPTLHHIPSLPEIPLSLMRDDTYQGVCCLIKVYDFASRSYRKFSCRDVNVKRVILSLNFINDGFSTIYHVKSNDPSRTGTYIIYDDLGDKVPSVYFNPDPDPS